MRRYVIIAAVTGTALLAGCTSPGPRSTRTVSRTLTRSASSIDAVPVPAGPTTVRDGACPFLQRQDAADAVGMRLARTQVLLNRGRPTGCRFYALQGSPLHRSEGLPGASQPAIEISSRQYRGGRAVHAVLVRLAQGGHNPQRARVAGSTGVCYQIDFYRPDHGADWTCAFPRGTTLVQVRTVVTSPALDVVRVARDIAPEF